MPEPAHGSYGAAASLRNLADRIEACEICPRLAEYRRRAAKAGSKRFKGAEYWGKPVAGFGDHDASLLIIGLAPAAHGGNRTGRVFTGDATSSFLTRALFKAGFANQPTSESRGDGLVLKDAYLTAAVRCAPPENKPTAQEVSNCSRYLHEEMALLKRVRAVLTLGHLAFDSYLDYVKSVSSVNTRGLVFRHGAIYRLGGDLPALFVSYHPSPRNTQTGTLTLEGFQTVFENIRAHMSLG